MNDLNPRSSRTSSTWAPFAGGGGVGPEVKGYRIVRQLKTCDLADTFVAEDISAGSEVVLRIVHAWLCPTPEAKAALQSRVGIFESIQNPHVVKILGITQSVDARLAFVTEALQGRELSEVIPELRPKPGAGDGGARLQLVLRLLRQLLGGLAAAHARGLVHGELGPTSCRVSGNAEQMHLQLLDFGLSGAGEPDDAAAPGDVGDATAIFSGRAEYSSPEHADQQPISQQTDIYLAGVLAYELLTGRVPFSGPNSILVLEQHRSKTPDRPSALVPDAGIPADLDEVVMRALEKSPDQRFQDMDEFERAISKFVTSTPSPTPKQATPAGPQNPLPPASLATGPTASGPAISGGGETTVLSREQRATLLVSAQQTVQIDGSDDWQTIDRPRSPGGQRSMSAAGAVETGARPERAAPTPRRTVGFQADFSGRAPNPDQTEMIRPEHRRMASGRGPSAVEFARGQRPGTGSGPTRGGPERPAFARSSGDALERSLGAASGPSTGGPSFGASGPSSSTSASASWAPAGSRRSAGERSTSMGADAAEPEGPKPRYDFGRVGDTVASVPHGKAKPAMAARAPAHRDGEHWLQSWPVRIALGALALALTVAAGIAVAFVLEPPDETGIRTPVAVPPQPTPQPIPVYEPPERVPQHPDFPEPLPPEPELEPLPPEPVEEPRKPRKPRVKPGIPLELSKTDIDRGVSRLAGGISACGSQHNAPAGLSFQIEFAVTPDGKVQRARAGGAQMPEALKTCVESRAEGLRFRRTRDILRKFSRSFRF